MCVWSIGGKTLTDLAQFYLSQWFKANQLVLNTKKTNIIKFTPINSLHSPLAIENANKPTEEIISTKLLGLQSDNHLNWKSHINHILPKLSTACFAVSRLLILNIEALRMVYFAYYYELY
jgi:hypothetical protein